MPYESVEEEILELVRNKYIANTSIMGTMGIQSVNDPEMGNYTQEAQDRIDLVMAQPNTAMPYLVHNFVTRTSEEDVVANCAYYIDVWDFSPNAKRILKLADLIRAELSSFHCSGEGFTNLRLWVDDFGLRETDGHKVWHYEMIYSGRYTKTRDIINHLARVN